MAKTPTILIACALAFGFWFAFPVAAQAADLYFSPSTGDYAPGDQFTVGVYVSSTDQAMNAASGVYSFPADKLEILSVSKGGSIMSLWVEEPSFSNAAGTGRFEGVVLNPGFTGAGGKILDMSFRVKAAGSATLRFTDGAVLANDGRGTNILQALGTATFSLRGPEPPGAEPAAPVDTPPPAPGGTPGRPGVVSGSHPDPDQWYPNPNAAFSWVLPADVTAVRLLYSDNPNSVPSVNYDPPIASRELEDVPDGQWYFHVRFRNAAGWGAVAHFPFGIDTEPPSELNVEVLDRTDLTNPRVKLLIDGQDAASGIDQYEIVIDDGEPIVWQNDGSGVFESPALAPGNRTIVVTAVDRAGNKTASTVQVKVSQLDPPALTVHTNLLHAGQLIAIRGVSYPDSQVELRVLRDGEEFANEQIVSDRLGVFTYIMNEQVEAGVYTLWGRVVDSRGARSEWRSMGVISVEPTASETIAAANRFIRYYQLIAIVSALASALLLAIFLIVLIRRRRLRMLVRRETRSTARVVHEVFDFLRDDMKQQAAALKLGKTSNEQVQALRKLLAHLKKSLDKAESGLKDRIEDIHHRVR
jgi:hypothetical protein